MCGIAGIFNFTNKVNESEIKRFTNSLKHRGPDDFGIKFFFDTKLALGHRRLNILDLSSNGRQPMSYQNSRYNIIFNGEIFNYLELKSELKNYGYKFYNQTDTEVILAAYDKWKENCFSKFNGMWSIAIWDDKLKKLCLSRDRFGEKPLYYRYINNKFCFASEIKSFIKLDDFEENEFDFEILENFKNLEGNENNIIKTVKTLRAGYNLIINHSGNYKIEKWWDMNDCLEQSDLNYDEKIEKFEELFKDACKLRLRSDRNLGISLSGGLDSTGLLATIKSIDNKVHIPSYSLIFNNTIYDEGTYVEYLNNFFPGTVKKIDYENINFSVDDLHKVILSNENLEEPHIGPWIIYREMKKNNIVVSLDGHGPDELLGGYYDHFKFAIEDEIDLEKKEKLINLRKEIYPNINPHIKKNYKKKSNLSKLFSSLFKKKNKIEKINFKLKHFFTPKNFK